MKKLFKIKFKTKEDKCEELEIVAEHLVDAMVILERYAGKFIYPFDVVRLPLDAPA